MRIIICRYRNYSSRRRTRFRSVRAGYPQPKAVREADALPGVRGRRQANPDAKLHTLFRRLVNVGNPVVIVEHRLELIAQADWIIDMGPGRRL